MGRIIPDSVVAFFNRLTGHSPAGPSPVPSAEIDHPLDEPVTAAAETTRLVFTFDIQGTLEHPPTLSHMAPRPNADIFHFMLDAATTGHQVFIVTSGFVDKAEPRMAAYAAQLGRSLGDVKVISKFDLANYARSVDVAFDDQKFDYLPALTATLHEVAIDKDGNPDLPLSYLREKFGIAELHAQPTVATPPAPDTGPFTGPVVF